MNSDKVASVRSKTLSSFESKVSDKTARVGIIGLGYVGLPLALLFGESGFTVCGFDVDPH